MKARILSGGAALAGVLALGAPAQAATTIFSDFGPGMTFDTGAQWAVQGRNPGITSASAFTSGGVFDVSQIDVALASSTDSTVIVSLRTDVGGVPGLGHRWTVPVPAGSSIVTVTGITGVHLNAGDSYFVGVAPGDRSFYGGWWLNDQGYLSDFAQNHQPYPMQTAGAFDVLGGPTVAVPEPGAWTMLILGLFGSGALLRGRRRPGLGGERPPSAVA
jgi:hypothetical protein